MTIKERAQKALDTAFPSTPEDTAYDVFIADNEVGYIRVPWGSRGRPVAVSKNEHGAFVNAADLPDGTGAGTAIYAGSIRRGKFPE
jgi:hypothetical protein